MHTPVVSCSLYRKTEIFFAKIFSACMHPRHREAVPKLRNHFAELLFFCSKDQRLLTSESCCGYRLEKKDEMLLVQFFTSSEELSRRTWVVSKFFGIFDTLSLRAKRREKKWNTRSSTLNENKFPWHRFTDSVVVSCSQTDIWIQEDIVKWKIWLEQCVSQMLTQVS